MARNIKGVILDDGVHSIDYEYLANRVPNATDVTYGIVKIDNDTIKVNESGQLYVSLPSTDGVVF